MLKSGEFLLFGMTGTKNSICACHVKVFPWHFFRSNSDDYKKGLTIINCIATCVGFYNTALKMCTQKWKIKLNAHRKCNRSLIPKAGHSDKTKLWGENKFATRSLSYRRCSRLKFEPLHNLFSTKRHTAV